MEEIIIPYELPEVENHSFFFIDSPLELILFLRFFYQMQKQCRIRLMQMELNHLNFLYLHNKK